MQSETTNTKTTGNIPVEDLKTLYLQYVRPTFEHASPAWFCGSNSSVMLPFLLPSFLCSPPGYFVTLKTL